MSCFSNSECYDSTHKHVLPQYVIMSTVMKFIIVTILKPIVAIQYFWFLPIENTNDLSCTIGSIWTANLSNTNTPTAWNIVGCYIFEMKTLSQLYNSSGV